MAEYVGLARPGASLRFIAECDRADSDVHIPRADLRDLIARVNTNDASVSHHILHRFELH